MMRGWWVIALGLVGAGCGGDDSLSADREGELLCDGGGSYSLVVSPLALERDEDVVIEIRWHLVTEVMDPSATLSTDRIEIEVDLPLAYVQYEPYATYVGQQRNPFGIGAPVGPVSVLASAKMRSGCSYAPSAATSFSLE